MAFADHSAVNLGTAGNFAVLAQTGVSTTGVTAVTGNVGISPAAASFITGFGLIADSSNTFSTSSLVNGSIYAADYTSPTPTVMGTAIGDMQTAYTDAAGRTLPNATELGSGDIGGMTLVAGLYKWSSAVTIPTDLILSGNSSDVWIFQIAQTLDISSSTHVNLTGGAQAKNVFWQVAGQATLGTTSVFNGIILSQTAVVLNTGAVLNGRALAQTAVTLDSNTVTAPASGPAVLTTINLTPSIANITLGSTRVLNITKLDQFGLPIGASIIYSSSNVSVATVAAINATSALVTSVAAGNTTITAASGAINGTSFITVITPILTTITLSPSTVNLTNGSTIQLNITKLNQFGAPISTTVNYTSTNTSVATVNAISGLITTVGIGNTTIIAANGSVNATSFVRVMTPVLASINLSPATVNLTTAQTISLNVTTLDQFGSPISSTVNYTSSNLSVATVNLTTGLITAVASGNTTITATNGTVNTTTLLRVFVPVLTRMTISPTTADVTLGNTLQMSSASFDQLGFSFNATVFYNSSNVSIATVNATTGLVTSVALGTATITVTNATNASINATANLTIIAVVVAPAAVQSSGGGGSGFSQGSSAAPVVNNSRSSTYQLLTAVGQYNVTFVNTGLSVMGIQLQLNSNATNVMFVAAQLDSKPDGLLALDASALHVQFVYSYLQINHTGLNNSQITSAVVQFKVPVAWVSANNLGTNQITLYRMTTEWDTLQTTLVSQDATYYYFEAKTPGLSYFAIGSQPTATDSTTGAAGSSGTGSTDQSATGQNGNGASASGQGYVTQPSAQNTTGTPSTPATSGSGASKWWLIGGIVVIAGLLVGGYFGRDAYYRNQNKPLVRNK